MTLDAALLAYARHCRRKVLRPHLAFAVSNAANDNGPELAA